MAADASVTELDTIAEANRELNHFGATIMHSSDVFNETGDSHPNLELRFLVINYLVRPAPDALALPNEFLDARAHPAGVLYQSSPPSPYSLFPNKTPLTAPQHACLRKFVDGKPRVTANE